MDHLQQVLKNFSKMEDDDMISLFVHIGLSEQKAKETAKNDHISAMLKETIQEAKKYCNSNIHKSMGMLLYHVATKLKTQCYHQMPLLVQYISNGKINTEMQLNAALSYLLAHPTESVNIVEFEKSSGIGIVITPEQIKATVTNIIEQQKNDIVDQRYQFNVGKLMGEVRQELVWADGKNIKEEVDRQILELLGPKTQEDIENSKKKPSKSVKEKGGVKTKADTRKKDTREAAASTATANVSCEEVENGPDSGSSPPQQRQQSLGEMMLSMNFHTPGENYKTDTYVITDSTMELLKHHLTVTDGKVRTRFPPEPNGILHIGHAKAININLGFAQATGGVCYLRYDDTNPEKEEEKFFMGIKEMVEWLGYHPWKITHSSDYFPQLYSLAVALIKSGNAYVCHQRAEVMKGHQAPPSPWRDRPIDESLQLFQDMKHGLLDEGEATLRMKTTLEEGKQDPVAYRIKFTHHHRTGNTWCIYPTYDYTHCLCDSLEHVSHSLCTKEFQSRRSSYYWLCNALNVYCPVQWEYGRLNVHYTVVSKRKIARLIDLNIVKDWDDPRLFTLTALRRRGFPPQSINNFISSLGVTGAQMSVDPQMLDAACRDVLNTTAPRHMVVLEPLKVTLSNYPPGTGANTGDQRPATVTVADFPQEPHRGHHTVNFTATVYIDRSDFSMDCDADKNYKRLTESQPVGLKYANYVISVDEVVTGDGGEVLELRATCHSVEECSKPKAFIHWVCKPVTCHVRLYDRLFAHKNPEDPEEVPGGFLSDCNKDTLRVLESVYIDESLAGSKPQVHSNYQFERVGYFSLDPESTPHTLVFNRTVSLRDGGMSGGKS